MRSNMRSSLVNDSVVISPSRSFFLFFLRASSFLMIFEAFAYVYRHHSDLIYLPAYLVVIYLFQFSWTRVFKGNQEKENLFIGFGLTFIIVRYLLTFTQFDPYLDFLIVTTFFCFAYSQALILQKNRWLRMSVTGVYLASLVIFALMIWEVFHPGQAPLYLNQNTLESSLKPFWFLCSVGLQILFLLDFHSRALMEIDDFTIRLRLGFLIATWLLFLGFFLFREGGRFGWFPFNQIAGDIVLVLSSIFITLGLAMPRWFESAFTALTFLDRRTSREVTLFVLSQIARNSTGSQFTELTLAAADRLGLSPEERRTVFLASELLEANFLGNRDNSAGRSSVWEELAVTSDRANRRLAAQQRLVFKAWRVKRNLEQGIPDYSLPFQIITAARDYLMGMNLVPRDNEGSVLTAVRYAAIELASINMSAERCEVGGER